MADMVVRYDRYGFGVFRLGSGCTEDDYRSHEYGNDGEVSSKVMTAWKRILSNWGVNQLSSPKQIRQSIKQGIPPNMRGDMWNCLIGSQKAKTNSSFDYQVNLKHIRKLLVDLGVSEYDGKNSATRLGQVIGSLKYTSDIADNGSFASPESIETKKHWDNQICQQIAVYRQIMLDIDRSFPSHKMFINGTTEGQEGRAALFRILALYANYNPQVSYCQGMSYIGGMLLMHMEEEDAFWCLVCLFERPKYLTGYFDDSLGKIQRHAAVFQRLMKQRRPAVFKHLESQCVVPLMYLTPWFMALFTSLPCWDAVLLIWDLLLLEGTIVIFQVALALVDLLSEKLMSVSELSHTLPLLLRPPAELVSRDRLLSAMSKIRLQRWEIDSIQAVLDEECNRREGRQTDERALGLPDKKRRGKNKVKRTRRLSSVTCELTSNPVKKQRIGSSVTEPSLPGDTPIFQPSLLQRVVDLFSTTFRQEATTSVNPNIEMSTFSKSVHGACEWNHVATPDSSLKHMRRHLDSVKRYHLTKGSTVRRSPRLAAKRTPLSVLQNSPSSFVRRSARQQHSFKVFNTPTPMRCSQVRALRQQPPACTENSPTSVMSPDVLTSPYVELMEIAHMEKKLDFTNVS